MDQKTGLVHHVEVTSANVHNVTVVAHLLTGEETEVYGDSGYLGAGKREDAVIKNKSGKQIKYKINRRPSQVQNHSDVPEGKSSAESMRSHRFGPRSSTFLRLSKGCSNIARPDTEAFENRSPN